MKRSIFILALVILISPVMAGDPGVPGGDPDEPVPIDGAMYVLMATGLFFGLRSIKRNR